MVSTGIPPLDDRTADLLRLLHADLGAAGFTVAELDDLWGTDAAAAPWMALNGTVTSYCPRAPRRCS